MRAKDHCESASRQTKRSALLISGVRRMESEQQNRFEQLFNSLLRHWIERNEKKEGSDDHSKTPK